MPIGHTYWETSAHEQTDGATYFPSTAATTLQAISCSCMALNMRSRRSARRCRFIMNTWTDQRRNQVFTFIHFIQYDLTCSGGYWTHDLGVVTFTWHLHLQTAKCTHLANALYTLDLQKYVKYTVHVCCVGIEDSTQFDIVRTLLYQLSQRNCYGSIIK